MTEDLFRLIYCSRSAMPPDLVGLQMEQIVAEARRANAASDVTGALIYNEGIFAQLLEGPFGAVRRIFERIQDDPRHEDVLLIQAHITANRVFGAWPMACAEVDDAYAAARVLRQALMDPSTEGPHNVLLLLENLVRRAGQEVPMAA